MAKWIDTMYHDETTGKELPINPKIERRCRELGLTDNQPASFKDVAGGPEAFEAWAFDMHIPGVHISQKVAYGRHLALYLRLIGQPVKPAVSTTDDKPDDHEQPSTEVNTESDTANTPASSVPDLGVDFAAQQPAGSSDDDQPTNDSVAPTSEAGNEDGEDDGLIGADDVLDEDLPVGDVPIEQSSTSSDAVDETSNSSDDLFDVLAKGDDDKHDHNEPDHSANYQSDLGPGNDESQNTDVSSSESIRTVNSTQRARSKNHPIKPDRLVKELPRPQVLGPLGYTHRTVKTMVETKVKGKTESKISTHKAYVEDAELLVMVDSLNALFDDQHITDLTKRVTYGDLIAGHMTAMMVVTNQIKSSAWQPWCQAKAITKVYSSSSDRAKQLFEKHDSVMAIIEDDNPKTRLSASVRWYLALSLVQPQANLVSEKTWLERQLKDIVYEQDINTSLGLAMLNQVMAGNGEIKADDLERALFSKEAKQSRDRINQLRSQIIAPHETMRRTRINRAKKAKYQAQRHT